jgi:hypothetical protein
MTDRNRVDRNDVPVRPGSTSDEMPGQTQDEPYSSEQAQRQKDAEQGRQAEWVATDPVD